MLGLPFRSSMCAPAWPALASLALAVALACGPARATDLDDATPDYLVPDAPGVTVETLRSAEGRLQINIRGERFDGRRLIRHVLADLRDAPPTKSDSDDYDLSIAVATLGGFNDEELHPVVMRLSRRAGGIYDFRLTAGPALVYASVHDLVPGKRTLIVRTNDAGALLRFLDLYDRLAKGSLEVTLDLPSRQDGHFDIRDAELPLDPVLQPLRRAMTAIEPEPTAQDSDPGPSRLQGRFALARGEIVVRDALFSNNAVRASLEGRIKADQVDMRGTLVPTPREPKLASCESFDCLLSLQYRLTGPIEAPRIVINPFANPGMLRRLLREQ
jgi:hypothetical protein